MLHVYRDGELADTAIVHKPALFREFADGLVTEAATLGRALGTAHGFSYERRGRGQLS